VSNPLAFSLLEVITLEYDETQALKVIENILSQKNMIENNPFADMPKDRLKKALSLLEEYSEEITEP
jgi:hypothetical protein